MGVPRILELIEFCINYGHIIFYTEPNMSNRESTEQAMSSTRKSNPGSLFKRKNNELTKNKITKLDNNFLVCRLPTPNLKGFHY